MALFRPKEKLQIFTDLNTDKLKEKGFDTVLLDIDNTIAVPDTGICDERAKAFIEKLKSEGFKVAIFSNNTKKRVKMFLNGMDVDYVYFALKPLPFQYWRACLMLKSKPEKTVVLGDQLLTDITGANLSGCYGIYCKQLMEKDTPMTSVNRQVEKLIWRYILNDKV
ncbi:MAG: YqeG family HAD IIIA-type phosphatase [Erysipelotrichaceae bacterium]|nr:YqeG family HAD IIIA-type phosphatase [Erysipelotrichaceae bacterium]